jgi:hypothetical protein
MLSVFINHRLLKRTVQVAAAREIYASFEQLLAWDYHYWLHRGALELEAGRLDLAEIFLRTAKGIEPSDVFVDNELAYLMFKKANAAPREAGSADLVREAVRMLEAISIQRPDQRAHIYHIMGAQGLLWVQQSEMSADERRTFLSLLEKNVDSVLSQDTDEMLATLHRNIRREILSIAVRS